MIISRKITSIATKVHGPLDADSVGFRGEYRDDFCKYVAFPVCGSNPLEGVMYSILEPNEEFVYIVGREEFLKLQGGEECIEFPTEVKVGQVWADNIFPDHLRLVLEVFEGYVRYTYFKGDVYIKGSDTKEEFERAGYLTTDLLN